MTQQGDKLRHPIKGVGFVREIHPATNQWGVPIGVDEIILEYPDGSTDSIRPEYLPNFEVVI